MTLSPGGLEGDQAGGLVTRSGVTVVHEGEAIVPERQIDRFRQGGGGGGGTNALESKLDDILRELRNLANRPIRNLVSIDAHAVARQTSRARNDFETTSAVTR